MAMGELRLDSREALLQGGSRGPAIAPGDPSSSLLVKAVSYTSIDLKMPPTGKLSDDEVDHLEAWIRMGAPDPRPPLLRRLREDGKNRILRKAASSAPLEPVGQPALPAVPATRNWVRTDVNRFVLARLEAEEKQPGRRGPADAACDE